MFFVGLGWWIHNCMFFHPSAEQSQWSCLVLVALGSVASGKQSSAGYIGYDLPERSSNRHQARIGICDSQKTQITWTCVVSGHQKHLMTGCSGGGQRGGVVFCIFLRFFQKGTALSDCVLHPSIASVYYLGIHQTLHILLLSWWKLSLYRAVLHLECSWWMWIIASKYLDRIDVSSQESQVLE